MILTRWLLSVMIATNQFANAVTGGDPYESISSRLGHARAHHNHFAQGFCALIAVFERMHAL